MLSPFLVSPLKTPIPLPCFYKGAPPHTHSLLPHIPSILLHRGITPSQNQEPLLLMSDKAILCFICSWIHGSLYVYSLVGGLVPGISRGSEASTVL